MTFTRGNLFVATLSCLGLLLLLTSPGVLSAHTMTEAEAVVAFLIFSRTGQMDPALRRYLNYGPAATYGTSWRKMPRSWFSRGLRAATSAEINPEEDGLNLNTD
ncbi:hypothetical protein BV898_11173 [Hypsibius exemplaris]|uniref:Uncharacterized protein n=1 Tax=Hypsibius exemplaris TaxID=2072580 RepID=A0A1W0WHK3_HYPEX|nr:hypothetical protein BV898_11173 [Hypsibius exemplaris]